MRKLQKSFYGHYIQDYHKGKDDWQFVIIDQCINNVIKKVMKGEFYWQHRFKMFFVNSLNEPEESCL